MAAISRSRSVEQREILFGGLARSGPVRPDPAALALRGSRWLSLVFWLAGIVVLLLMAWSSQRWDAALRETITVGEHFTHLRLFVLRAQAFADRLAQTDPPAPPGQLGASYEAMLESGRALEKGGAIVVLPHSRWHSATLDERAADYARVLNQLYRRLRAAGGKDTSVVESSLLLGLANDSALRAEKALIAEVEALRREQRLFDRINVALLLVLVATTFYLGRRAEERRRAAIDDLVASERRLQLYATVLEGTRDGVIVTGPELRVVSVNRAFSTITGYAEAEVLDRSPRMFRPGRHEAAFFREMWETVGRVGYWQGELWIQRRDGEVVPLSMSISAVPDEAGGVRYYVGVFTDLSQLRRSEALASHLAQFDPLTELPNRQLIGERLGEAVTAAAAGRQHLAVLYIDLDRFGHINDALGHEAGDELMVAVARRLAHRVGDTAMLGRHGSDEFVVVVGGMRAEIDAEAVAQEVLKALDETFEIGAGRQLHVQASIGISIYPDDGGAAAELLQRADAAMYQAKREGRNLVRFYRQSLTLHASARLALESRLRRALEHEGFELHYQPIFDIRGRRVVGAEALVRLKEDGELPATPAEFIPILEDSDLIVDLGQWVRREVCRQGRQWLDEGRRFEFLAVNLSPEEIRRGGVVEHLDRTLAETGFPPTRLELEITETSLMQGAGAALEALDAINALEVGLSIDDFGTGYSSLAYLKRFPVNKLKIDRSFIRDLPQDPNDVRLTATIIELGRSLGLKVLAEGVEDAAQLDFLAARGCDYFQGHLCSPPLPAADFAARFLPLAGGGKG
jgi:diguanylate cyclase (GGDEF)-like protein/PAS domain S-box-containing protein